MKMPREIDELMWEVAEMDDLDTIDQFGARYPEFRSELVKRLHMVRNLKGSRPSKKTPQFVPSQTVRNLGPSKLAVATVSMIVLGSMAFATFATVQYVQSQDKPVESSGTEYVLNPPSTVTDSVDRENMSPSQIEKDPVALPPDSVQPLREFDTFDFAVTIESDDTSLVEVINQISRDTGADINIAPGFEDVRIRIRFIDQPAKGVLEELGIKFGFTAMRQSSSSMIIIPTRDDSVYNFASAYGAVEEILDDAIIETDDEEPVEIDSGDVDNEVSDSDELEPKEPAKTDKKDQIEE